MRLPTVAIMFGVSTLLLFASLATGEDVSAKPAPAKPVTEPLRVRVDLNASEEHIEGTMDVPGVTLKTETGSQTIDAKHLSRITYSPDAGEEGHDAVQTTDKHILRGHLVSDTVTVKVGSETRTLNRKEIREIRVLRPKDTSILGIAIGLFTLAAMEIVLGIDNIIFLAIVAGRLPKERQPAARKIGLAAALGTRLMLLFTLSFLLGLTAPVFTLPDLPMLHDLEAREISWRDIILAVGGLFLIAKSVREMHEKMEEARHASTPEHERPVKVVPSFAKVIFTIAMVDIIFSLDSVITAVGMVDEVWVMAVAMIIAMAVMIFFAEPISEFVNKHPTIKVLALSFLILIGVMLVAESLGQHIDKGYIYFAMAFAVAIEMINLRLRRSHAKAPQHENE